MTRHVTFRKLPFIIESLLIIEQVRSTYQSVYLLSLYPSLIDPFLYLLIHPSICLIIHLSIFLSIHHSSYLFIHPSINLFIYPSSFYFINLYPSIYLYPSITLIVYPSIHPSIYLSIHSFTCPFTICYSYPSIYLSICPADIDDENWCQSRTQDYPSGLLDVLPPSEVTSPTEFRESALNLQSFPLSILITLAAILLAVPHILRV